MKIEIQNTEYSIVAQISFDDGRVGHYIQAHKKTGDKDNINCLFTLFDMIKDSLKTS